VANLRTRFEYHHNTEGGDAQKDFAEFVGRQAALVLDIAERRLQGGALQGTPACGCHAPVQPLF
jgi:glycerol-3-phosphate O-acyltransferase